MLKEKLKWWNREVLGFKGLHIDKLVKEMNELEKVAAEGGSPNVDVEQTKELNAKFWQEICMKESMLTQKSRTRWIAKGDSNTRFFHACIRSNRRRTQLLKLKVDDERIEDVRGGNQISHKKLG